MKVRFKTLDVMQVGRIIGDRYQDHAGKAYNFTLIS